MTDNADLRRYYLDRARAFVLSAGAHATMLLMLICITSAPTRIQEPSDRVVKSNAHRLVFYPFRQTSVPDVVPVNRIGKRRDPSGAKVSRRAIIAASAKPKSSQVIISLPVPKLETSQDIPVPILVARPEIVVPRPVEPPRPRKFVLPKASEGPPTVPVSAPILDIQAPPTETIYAFDSRGVKPVLGAARVVALPPVEDLPQSHAGNADAELAVAALHPVENAEALIPAGSRPGKFSTAPTPGEASSGDGDGRTGLTLADLAIRDSKREAALRNETEEILYSERVRSASLSTLSVPLRPSSRMIPAAVDARFMGRNVYTIVIPMERIPAYAGDWILWFADRRSNAGETPVMRAPIPIRKVQPVERSPVSARMQERIQLSATLGKTGKLEGVIFLTTITAAVQRAVSADIACWEFQPATNGGIAVEVDMILEIPFLLPTEVAANQFD